MICVTGKKWEQKKINKNSIEKLKQDHNFSETLSKLLISRNFDINEIYTVENDLALNNVFKNNDDFNKSINLLEKAINNNEYICILGDYDVDGSAATFLFIRYLESINHSFFFLHTRQRN